MRAEVRADFGGSASLTVLNLWRAFFLLIAGLVENGREGGARVEAGGVTVEVCRSVGRGALDRVCVVGGSVCFVAGVRAMSVREGGEGGGVLRMGTPLGVEGDC